MKLFAGLMGQVTTYRLWQAPFVDKKLAPVLRYNDLNNARRVLDVGCGPGTNTRCFEHAEYLGLDWSSSYVEYARGRFRRDFIVTDVCSYEPPAGVLYDFILVNSFLHHVDNDSCLRILSKLKNLLTEDGHVHILDLLLPKDPSVARLFAQWDRGDFARPLEEWKNLLSVHFEPVIVEPYPLTALGISLWNMVYFKGSARR